MIGDLNLGFSTRCTAPAMAPKKVYCIIQYSVSEIIQMYYLEVKS